MTYDALELQQSLHRLAKFTSNNTPFVPGHTSIDGADWITATGGHALVAVNPSFIAKWVGNSNVPEMPSYVFRDSGVVLWGDVQAWAARVSKYPIDISWDDVPYSAQWCRIGSRVYNRWLIEQHMRVLPETKHAHIDWPPLNDNPRTDGVPLRFRATNGAWMLYCMPAVGVDEKITNDPFVPVYVEDTLYQRYAAGERETVGDRRARMHQQTLQDFDRPSAARLQKRDSRYDRQIDLRAWVLKK